MANRIERFTAGLKAHCTDDLSTAGGPDQPKTVGERGARACRLGQQQQSMGVISIVGLAGALARLAQPDVLQASRIIAAISSARSRSSVANV
jgi:hypothetical protein